MERFSREAREPEGTKEKRIVIKGREVVYRLTFLGGLILGATSGCTEVNLNQVGEDFPSVESYDPELLEELLKDEITEEEGTVIVFLDPSEGSGLDEQGFAKEQVEVFIEEEETIEEEVREVESIEIPEEVQEILSVEQNLSFNQEGQLSFKNEEGEEVPVLTFETERHLVYPYEQVKEVKFFVIHYDGAPQTFLSGRYRTVFSTLNGLNREGNPSVQFCVDSYPISADLADGEGLGLIHSQKTNTIPYKGRHVQVGINLETGVEDVNRIKTARMYEKLGVGSNYIDFVDSGNKDFDSYSLGVEQVGTNYSINFPDQFPPKQQIANILALTKAVALEYDLSVWDIIAHREIQEKSDPGEEYMLTLRYMLGVSYMLDESDLPENFLETEDPYEYFAKLREYGIMRMGEERYGNWNSIYEMDEILSDLESGQKQTFNPTAKRALRGEELL